jgi:hypothetical protein
MMTMTETDAINTLLLVGLFSAVSWYWGYRFRKFKQELGEKTAKIYLESALLIMISSNLAKIIIDGLH